MSARLDVLRALIALVGAAVPGAEILGLDPDEDAPARVRAGGRIVVRAGDPGQAEVDLSPLTYNWTHQIPIEIVMADEDTLDAALMAIGDAIEADRQLGERCDWLEADAPATQGVRAENAAGLRGTAINITAIYATSSPLT